MLQTLAFLSTVALMTSGAVFMALGEWRPLKLKFAALTISTVTSMYMLLVMYFVEIAPHCTTGKMFCNTWGIYHIARNAAFLMFHFAIGRDAIRIRKKDRRENQWTRNL